MEIYDLTFRQLVGEELTEEEEKRVRDHRISYDLVQFLVCQKLLANGTKLKNFQFTPGPNFLETPIIDTVNDILDIFDKTDRGEIQPVPLEEFE